MEGWMADLINVYGGGIEFLDFDNFEKYVTQHQFEPMFTKGK
jgi:hypothetical protein